MAEQVTVSRSELETEDYEDLLFSGSSQLKERWEAITQQDIQPYMLPVNKTEDGFKVIEGEERLEYFEGDEVPCQVVEVGKADEILLAVGFRGMYGTIDPSKLSEVILQEGDEVLEELREKDVDSLDSLVEALEKLSEMKEETETDIDGPMEKETDYEGDEETLTQQSTISLEKDKMEEFKEALELFPGKTQGEKAYKMAIYVLVIEEEGELDLSKTDKFDNSGEEE